MLREPTDQQVAEAASQIGQIVEQASLRLAVSVGRVIVDVFYGGDPTAISSHAADKPVSLRKLADRPDVPYGVSRLSRFVRVYALYEAVRATVRPLRPLCFSHYDAVLPLPFAEQREVLERAAAEGWSRAQTREAVAERRHNGHSHGGGRPPLPTVVKVVRSLHAMVERTHLAAEIDSVCIDLKPAEARDVYCRAKVLEEQLAALIAQLEPRIAATTGGDGEPEP